MLRLERKGLEYQKIQSSLDQIIWFAHSMIIYKLIVDGQGITFSWTVEEGETLAAEGKRKNGPRHTRPTSWDRRQLKSGYLWCGGHRLPRAGKHQNQQATHDRHVLQKVHHLVLLLLRR